MSRPVISVIIINYNTFELTCQCIASVLERTESIAYEIILVDNASIECSPQLFTKKFPNIHLIESSVNLGFAGGNNLGIAVAQGDVILLLNSDTKLINNAVLEGYSKLIKDEQIGVLSGACLYPNLLYQGVAGRFPTIKGAIRELLRINKGLTPERRKSYYLGEEWDYTQPVEADWVWGAFFMFRKGDLAQFPNGKLHDTFFMYGEDVQWCYHFKHVLKKKVVYHPAPKVIHYIGGSDKSNQDGFEKYKQKMLPHEYVWLTMVKGVVYTRIYYFIKSLLYFSLLKKSEIKKALLYFKIALKGIK